MIRPLRDFIVVEPLDDIYNGLIQLVRLDNKVRRGKVVGVGPKAIADWGLAEGQVIQFTDVCKYPEILDRGERRLMLQAADVCGVEEELAA